MRYRQRDLTLCRHYGSVISRDSIRHELEQTEAALAHFRLSFNEGKPDRSVFRKLWDEARRLRTSLTAERSSSPGGVRRATS
jgi:hypothetical protein